MKKHLGQCLPRPKAAAAAPWGQPARLLPRAPGGGGLAALAHARALLGSPEHTPCIGKGEDRFMPRLRLAGQDPQSSVHRWGSDDLPWVENTGWVEGLPCPHKPCFDRCRFAEPFCLTGIDRDDVWQRLTFWLKTLETPHVEK